MKRFDALQAGSAPFASAAGAKSNWVGLEEVISSGNGRRLRGPNCAQIKPSSLRRRLEWQDSLKFDGNGFRA